MFDWSRQAFPVTESTVQWKYYTTETQLGYGIHRFYTIRRVSNMNSINSQAGICDGYQFVGLLNSLFYPKLSTGWGCSKIVPGFYSFRDRVAVDSLNDEDCSDHVDGFLPSVAPKIILNHHTNNMIKNYQKNII